MPSVFHPEHSALDQIFAQNMKFIIPEYQRPYSWQAEGKNDRNNQINQMWDDLWLFYRDKNSDKDKEYFFGSMVIIEKELRTREVVDGQQRLTSLVLLFTAMRCFLQQQLAIEGEAALTDELRPHVERAKNKLSDLIYNDQGIGLLPELKVKIARSHGQSFDTALNDAANCKSKDAISSGDAKFEEIAKRYFDNRDYFLEQITKTFLDGDNKFGTDEFQALNDFYTFLTTRVAIVLIKTADFETAYSIFEILNNRGLPLSNTDLFRNFVINHFAEQTKENGADAWYRLEEDYALTEDFTARWVESRTASKQRQSAFSGIQKIYENEKPTPIKTKIEVFHSKLEQDLGYYSLIIEPDERIDDPKVCNAVKFIAALGNLRYSTTLLLAMFRHYRYDGGGAPAGMSNLLSAYSRYALSIWLQPRRRFVDTPIYQAIRYFRDQKPGDALEQFSLDDDELQKLSARIDGPLENNVARLLLAVYIWATSEEAEDVVTQRLDLTRATLEHIIPVVPMADSNWMTDFSDSFRSKYTSRLGNMTLLTSKMNSRAKNSSFTKKKNHYAKTLLGITRDLAQLDEITEEYIQERHSRMVRVLRLRWNLPGR